MIEVHLNKIKVDENRSEQIIILKEKGGKRYLPVVIGIAEVNAIKLKLSGVSPPRPLTHDLLANTISLLGARVEQVVIDRLENNTYFAKLYLRTGEGNVVTVDARPSDSVALALRANAPMFIEESVLNVAGISEN